MGLQQEIDRLFVEQQEEWEQLKNSLRQLESVQTKSFGWGNEIVVKVQFNPDRIVSVGAKVDKTNIEQRPCFLCEENRPKEQRGIVYQEKYTILVNPFPILKNHLTIPIQSHVPQRIRRKIGDMMDLAQQLPDYIVFYNGPKCGASAPDHFHLQAGLKQPVLMAGDNELRSCLVIESKSKEEIEERFEDVYLYLKNLQPDEDEPMMNLIAFTSGGKYVLHVFPRKSHRPRQYFETGKRQLLISPGALDMAGLMITARTVDFDKIRKEDIEDIYSQVSMSII